jgi:hypothetical protein
MRSAKEKGGTKREGVLTASHRGLFKGCSALTCGSGGPSAGDCQRRTRWWATDDVRNLDYPSTNMIVGVVGIRWSESAAAAAAAGSRKHRSDSAGREEAGDGWSEGLEIESGWLSGASFLAQDPEIGDEGGREQAGQG